MGGNDAFETHRRLLGGFEAAESYRYSSAWRLQPLHCIDIIHPISLAIIFAGLFGRQTMTSNWSLGS